MRNFRQSIVTPAVLSLTPPAREHIYTVLITAEIASPVKLEDVTYLFAIPNDFGYQSIHSNSPIEKYLVQLSL